MCKVCARGKMSLSSIKRFIAIKDVSIIGVELAGVCALPSAVASASCVNKRLVLFYCIEIFIVYIIF